MKKFFNYLLSLFYVLAGVNHFLNPNLYMEIMPGFLPWHYLLVIISGILEIILGIIVLIPSLRRYGAWGIIFLLIVIFPANIQMAVNWYYDDNPYLWLTIIRLPIQILLITWAWVYTKKNFNKKEYEKSSNNRRNRLFRKTSG